MPLLENRNNIACNSNIITHKNAIYWEVKFYSLLSDSGIDRITVQEGQVAVGLEKVSGATSLTPHFLLHTTIKAGLGSVVTDQPTPLQEQLQYGKSLIFQG